MNTQRKETDKLVIYGHNYCLQAMLLIKELDECEVDYEWRDVRKGEPQFEDELRQLANGNLSVPTVIFPDGEVMVEPWPGQVLKKLGLRKPSRVEEFLQRWQQQRNAG